MYEVEYYTIKLCAEKGFTRDGITSFCKAISENEKLTPDDRIIDWSKSACEIVRKIHGLSDEPSATTHTPDGKLLKIFRAKVSDDSPEGEIGEVVSVKKKLQVKAGEGSVLLLELQGEGSKRMKFADFLNGRRIALGDKLGE